MIKLVIDELFSCSFFWPLRVRLVSTVLKFLALYLFFNLVNLLILSLQKRLLPANKLVLFLAFLCKFLTFLLRYYDMHSIAIHILNVVVWLLFVRRFNKAISVFLWLYRISYCFNRNDRKGLVILHLLEQFSLQSGLCKTYSLSGLVVDCVLSEGKMLLLICICLGGQPVVKEVTFFLIAVCSQVLSRRELLDWIVATLPHGDFKLLIHKYET